MRDSRPQLTDGAGRSDRVDRRSMHVVVIEFEHRCSPVPAQGGGVCSPAALPRVHSHVLKWHVALQMGMTQKQQ